VKSPFTDREDYVLVTASRGPVQQRNPQRALDKAKEAAGLDGLEGRLSWHSLRRSAGSIWLTEFGIPIATVSAMMGHANPALTLACYTRPARRADDDRGRTCPRGGLLMTDALPDTRPMRCADAAYWRIRTIPKPVPTIV
jgi:integrase